MRSDRALGVFGEIIAKLSLADEHVEVILPEVRHHFAQLPLAHDSSGDLGRQQVVHEFPIALRLSPDLHAVGAGEHGVAAKTRLQLLRGAGRIVAKKSPADFRIAGMTP
jgi:hypothetical protein